MGGIAMTRAEFAEVMLYLEAGCGKSLPDTSMEVFFDLLGDLPQDVLRVAAQRVILEHRWATFPSLAELRAAAAETIQGQVNEISPGQAWGIATKACWSCDVEE